MGSSTAMLACFMVLLASAPGGLSAKFGSGGANNVVNITLNGVNIFGLKNFGEVFYYEDLKLVGYDGQENSFDLGAKSIDSLKDKFEDIFRGPPGSNTTLQINKGLLINGFINEKDGIVYVLNGTSSESNPVDPCNNGQSRGLFDKFTGPIGPITDIKVSNAIQIDGLNTNGTICISKNSNNILGNARSLLKGPQGPDAILYAFNTTTIANLTNYGKLFIYNDKIPLKYKW